MGMAGENHKGRRRELRFGFQPCAEDCLAHMPMTSKVSQIGLHAAEEARADAADGRGRDISTIRAARAHMPRLRTSREHA